MTPPEWICFFFFSQIRKLFHLTIFSYLKVKEKYFNTTSPVYILTTVVFVFVVMVETTLITTVVFYVFMVKTKFMYTHERWGLVTSFTFIELILNIKYPGYNTKLQVVEKPEFLEFWSSGDCGVTPFIAITTR